MEIYEKSLKSKSKEMYLTFHLTNLSKKQKLTRMIPGCFSWQWLIQGLVYAESQTNQNKTQSLFVLFENEIHNFKWTSYIEILQRGNTKVGRSRG